ncbi:DUF2330 domain-containing protein [Mycobacterium sp. M26]|uniref:DUF2330 domain-containing protein n=1 Tax=Mycobacterium sp. M26 TaxID=1762962 RepID=UPI00073F8B17|nr:DUF2330 domain-containing protein [Mycobacterium sp. M26]
MRATRLFAAVLLAAGMLIGSPGGPAGACACGGIVSPDLDARVTGEQALIARTGGKETIVMALDVESIADNAGLIVPTPAPATASSTDPGIFAELARLSAPRVEPGAALGSGLDEAGARPGGTPTVVAQVQLGPLEATTLTGGDLSGVRGWLDGHGYRMRPEVTAQLDPYLREGWSFVAMRLTGTKPLSGQLDPVRLDFDSDQLVYPMRMSAAAKDTQRVVVYTLADHRMQRTDADANRQAVRVDYAGPIQGRTSDPTLTALSDGNPYLTKISTTITDPAAIGTDFTFGPAPSDDPYQQVIRNGEPEDNTALLAAVGATVLVAVAAALIAVVWIRRQRRAAR